MDGSFNSCNAKVRDFPLLPRTQSYRSAPSASSQFLQPSLTRTRTNSRSPERPSDDLWAPDAAAALAGVQSPDTDMDGAGHRRRRSSLMNSLDTSAKSKTKARSPKSPIKAGIGRDSRQEEPKTGDRERLIGEREHLDDESTSEDVELDDLSEEEELQDDEETGLTGKHKDRRKRKRRRNTLLDQRVAANITITAEEKKEADQNVVKNLLINGFLIGLWYLFSLSISIVSPILPTDTPANVSYRSIISGCSTQSTSISTSPCLRPASTCSCNFPSHPSSCFCSPNFVHDTMPLQTHIIHIRMPKCCSMGRNPRSP